MSGCDVEVGVQASAVVEQSSGNLASSQANAAQAVCLTSLLCMQNAAQGSAGLAAFQVHKQAPSQITLELRIASCTARIAFSHIPFLQVCLYAYVYVQFWVWACDVCPAVN